MTRPTAGIDYDASHRLNPGATFLDAPGSPSGVPIDLWIVERPDRRQSGESAGNDSDDDDDALELIEKEARVVGRRIREWVGLDGAAPLMLNARRGASQETRAARFGDIAVLLRSPKRKERLFARVLQSMGVPVITEGRDGFFAAQEVRDVRALLDVLVNRRQDIPLAAVLTGPIADLDNAEAALAALRIAYPPGSNGVAFHQAVHQYATERSDAPARRLREILARIERWRVLASQRPVAELLGILYDESSLPTIVNAMPGGKQRFANLMLLHDLARQFGAFQRQGLARFTEFLDNLEDDADFGPATLAESAGNAVRMMSIHRSKGLEFPIVVLADLGKQFNQDSLKQTILLDRDVGIAPTLVDEARRVRFSSLASVVARQQIADQQMAEEIRVLYVAMTRAKEKLVLVGSSSAAALQTARRDWSGHVGPLPPARVLGARSVLDWLLPIAATAGPSIIAATMVTIPDATQAEDPLPSHKRAAVERVALPHTSAAMQRAIASLDAIGFVYPHREVASRPAATSVTAVAKPAPPPSVMQSERDEVLDAEFLLPPPTFLAGVAASATDRGTATHILLQHLDFRSADTAEGLQAQLRQLIDRR
ncbi:MAG TPA: 3'-5' exonuclease, partial [Tepidisphaeraceae bacterium]|nr:3'-5' exonuclease [Tepidisphaeraceae bacterium]